MKNNTLLPTGYLCCINVAAAGSYFNGAAPVATMLDSALEASQADVQRSGGITEASARRSLVASFKDIGRVASFADEFCSRLSSRSAWIATRCGLAAVSVDEVDQAALEQLARMASRLCQAANPGEIVLDEPAGRSLLASKRTAAVPTPASMTVPGMPGPVAVWTVKGAHAAAAFEPGSAPSHAVTAMMEGPGMTTEWDGSGTAVDVNLVRDAPDPTPQREVGNGPSSGLSTTLAASVVLVHQGLILTHTCDDGAIEIGRSPGPEAPSRLRVEHPRVSARHCRLEHDATCLWISDSSTNGTLLIGDDGWSLRVHQRRMRVVDPTGWIVLGRSRSAPRIRYHFLQEMGVGLSCEEEEPYIPAW